MNIWLAVASVSGALAVLLGAMGAHSLQARLSADQLSSWGLAVQYHLIHSLVLLALGLYASVTGRAVNLPALLFTAGILLFAGSIYLLALGGPRWIGPVTPLGGLCLIVGWLSILTLLRGDRL